MDLGQLSNHLGNVLAVVSDRKLAHESGGISSDGIPLVDYYDADVTAHSEYYPFGMTSRSGTDGGNYRYGFQGQEMDDEIKGSGNSVNYKYRMHDPRIGRFFAVDPLTPKYPELTPYQFSSNNPIGMIEIEGLEGAPVNNAGPRETNSNTDLTPSGGSITLPGSAEVLSRFDGTGSVSECFGCYGRQEGTPMYESSLGVNIAAVSGGVSSFAYDGVVYLAAFNSKGSFIGYSSEDDFSYTNNILIAPGLDISYSSSIVTSADYEIRMNGQSSELGAIAVGGSSRVPGVGLIIAGSLAVSYGWLVADQFDFELTYEPPLSVPIDAIKSMGQITLYRGVNPEHLDFMNAQKGIATPLGGHVSPRRHNEENNTFSIFTSWTVSRQIANQWATVSGPGGVVLVKQFYWWELVPSPDVFEEGEVLAPFLVTGALVTPPGPR